jgi:hypothetical protein
MLPQLDDMTRRVLDRASTPDQLDALGALFLVRQYRATGHPDVSARLEQALGAALARDLREESTLPRARWLRLFVEASTVSVDTRLLDAARDLVTALSGEWPRAVFVDEAAASVDACLAASPALDSADVLQRAIDALEDVVGHSYRPGAGVAHRIHRGADGPGDLADHARLASALLTAFDLTARLPYSMLAEELMQTVRDRAASADFASQCESVRVWCRLAALHDDAEYRAAAVIVDADYRVDAERILARLADDVGDESADVGLYALTLDEYMRLRNG